MLLSHAASPAPLWRISSGPARNVVHACRNCRLLAADPNQSASIAAIVKICTADWKPFNRDFYLPPRFNGRINAFSFYQKPLVRFSRRSEPVAIFL